MKCLPTSKLRLAQGNVLHDSHAEILALRAFNRFLIDECAELARAGRESQGNWLRWSDDASNRHVQEEPQPPRPPFALRDDVHIFMYCSEAPCGDASMELTMAAQADATPWPTPPPPQQHSITSALLGRGHFDQLGIVRRKPARADAPPTGSKSCSDKLALKQCTSVLNGLTSLLVRPEGAYLAALVLPASQHIPHAVDRAFGAGGRMAGVLTDPEMQRRWAESGHAFRPFQVCATGTEFEFSKRVSPGDSAPPLLPPVPSNLAAVYTPARQEVLINGVLQGRRQGDPNGASCVSRRALWESVREVVDLVEGSALAQRLSRQSYADGKRMWELKKREDVKADVKAAALRGWKRNEGDEEWSLCREAD